ncbi:MAG: hypothetical protein ACRD8W_15710, partial [Nitrososphaeraceae archaeon]
FTLIMLNQNSSLIDKLESLKSNISYVVTLNLMGEIIHEHYRDIIETDLDSEKIMNGIRRIITVTSLLNFDNVKFLMFEENDHKNIIINLQETSVVICLSKDASVSDVLGILNEIVIQH